MVKDAYLWIIPYSQHCFLWNFVFYSRKAYLAHQCKKIMCHPYSYQIIIDENPIPLQWICVLSYLCLPLIKVLFETSFKSFLYNTEGRRLSKYSIKLIWCPHYRSRFNGQLASGKRANSFWELSFDTNWNSLCVYNVGRQARSSDCIDTVLPTFKFIINIGCL